jgi:hypothetical protein
MRTRHVIAALGCALVLVSGCGDGETAQVTVTAPGAADVCDTADGALSDAGFVFVTAPAPGTRVDPGFRVEGCSRSFESNVPWELLGADGEPLASGAAMGGGVDGPGPFAFTVDYSVPARQIGVLVVREDDPSGGEGLPPKDNRIPVVLRP